MGRRYKMKNIVKRKSKCQPQELSGTITKKAQGPGNKRQSRPKLADVVHATTTIQRAYRKYKKRKEERVRQAKKHEQPQIRLKHHKSKQELLKKTTKTSQVPVKRQKSTPKFSDIVHSAVIIQRTYRSFKKRKHARQQKKFENKPK